MKISYFLLYECWLHIYETRSIHNITSVYRFDLLQRRLSHIMISFLVFSNHPACHFQVDLSDSSKHYFRFPFPPSFFLCCPFSRQMAKIIIISRITIHFEILHKTEIFAWSCCVHKSEKNAECFAWVIHITFVQQQGNGNCAFLSSLCYLKS